MVFLQRHLPTLTRCVDYDVTAPSTKRSTAASSESFFVPFDHCNLTRVARKLHSCHGGSLCFGESHSAERRHSQSTCCCWLAEHRQRVHQRLAGIHNNRSLVAHEIGRSGIVYRGTGKRISQAEHRAPPASTSNRRAVPGWTTITATSGLTKRSRPPSPGVPALKPAEQSIVFANNLHGQTT